MKKIILSLLLVLSTQLMYGQEIVKNETDEFTGASLVRTSWEKLNWGETLLSYVSFGKVDDTYLLILKVMLRYGKVFSVDKGQVIYIKFSDDEILKLYNSEYQISSAGAGAVGITGSAVQGVMLTYVIDEEKLQKLKEKIIIKVRVNTTNGFGESKVKTKRAKKLQKLASLLD